MSRFASLIEQKARDVIDVYWESRARWNPARSLKNLTAQATQEYENRFLIELIQNAYDAHAAGTRDGSVHLRLNRDEGQHGVLYVANGGVPFKKSNFLAITEIAQSDKLPGAGIGNKGVGFRSVLQVCPWPEIYSADPDDTRPGHFTGFCFRFATPDDVRRLVGENDAKCQAVLDDISPYFLPVPLATIPPPVRTLGKEGPVTVLRLPLHTATALASVEQQIGELLSATAPVLLFLDRLRRLVIETVNGNAVKRTELSRGVLPLAATSGERPPHYEVVELGTQGRFFVATGEVPPPRLRRAIEESIAAEKIEPKWREWKEKAYVSAAVRLDSEEGASHLYTFLPMGAGVPAPFAGHLNAPFATKLARTSLSEDIPLNALLLDVGAELAADAILFLRTREEAYSGTAILDLLTWRAPHHERLTRAFTALGKDIGDADIVPIRPLPDGRAWGTLGSFCEWDWPDLTILTAETLVRVVGAEILSPAVSSSRIERLGAFCGLIDYGTTHCDDTVASWCQSVAEDLLREKFQPARWDAFYDDLAEYPWDDGTKPLAGRKILLDDERQLRAAGSAEGSEEKTRDAVFFPPTKERTEDDEQVDANLDLSVPSTLRKHICFMHADLVWYRREGSTLKRKTSRDFLQKQGLVQRYDTRGLIEHVGALLGRTESQRIFADALRWTFNLQRATGASRRLALDKLPLRVPTPSGWVEASGAYFSADWPGTRGRVLADLIEHTKGVCDELSALEGFLLLPPAAWPFAVSELGIWVSFLRAIGVQDGLSPRTVGRPTELTWKGRDWTAARLSTALKMRPEDQAVWSDAIAAAGAYPSHPNTAYQLAGPVYRLPGQSDHGAFPQRAKELYARLIFDGLARWPEEAYVATLKRAGRPHDQAAVGWASPLAAFLARAPWVPMIWPHERRGEVFCPPGEAWHFSEKAGEPLPTFAPFLPSDLRRLIDAGERARTVLVRLGLNTWNDPTSAKQLLLHLGALVRTGDVEEAHVASFRRVYEKAWTDLVQGGLGTPFANAPADAALVVTAGDALAALSPSPTATLYVQGGQDQLAARLLNNLTLPVLTVGARHEGAVASLLALHFPRVKAVSAVKVSIMIDGQPYQPRADCLPLIDADRSWLKELVVLAIELKARWPASDHAIRSVLSRLSRIRLQRVSRLAVVVDGHDTELPPSLQNAMPVKDGQTPTVLWRGEQEALSWEALATITPHLAQLLEVPSLAADLHLAVIQLAQLIGGEHPRRPTLEEFSHVFSARSKRVEEVCRSIRSAAPVVLEALRPVLWHYAGAAAVAALPTDDSGVTEETLVATLSPYAEKLPCPPRELLRECAETTDPGALRTRLQIGYAEFNRALRELGAPYRPLHNREGHANAFAHHRQSQRERILRALRARFLKEYECLAPLDGYVAARALDGLAPDPDWLDVCDLPTAEMMEGRVTAWLRKVGVRESDTGIELPPIDTVRATNRRFAGEKSARTCRLVRAWCAKHKSALPALWATADDAKEKVLELGDRTGVFDFREMTEAVFLAWLARQGAWPGSMPATAELAQLGLTEEALSAETHAAEEERRKAEFERRSIELDGKRVSAETTEFSALAQALLPTVGAAFLKRPKSLTALEEVKARAAGGAKGTGAGGAKRRPTEAQKGAIGFVGELLAYEWLQHQYPGVVPDNWKSAYRNYVFGGNSGNDGLGYDFEVLLSNRRLLFEVKATAGDRLEIELGETEVALAQKLSRGNLYRILFIPHALDSKARSLYVLPNPFSEAGRKFYRVVGTGLRYQFQMKL